MPPEWVFEDRGTHLQIQVRGPYTRTPSPTQYIGRVAQEAAARQHWRVLLDLCALEGDIPPIDRYAQGEEAARRWGRRLKVAVLVRPELLTRFFENVAVNRGAFVRVFSDPDEANSWLISGQLT